MKKLMAANWKMYKTVAEGTATARELAALVAGSMTDDREVLICPPFTMLAAVREALGDAAGFCLGAQNFYPSEQGAFTGEIAPEQLLDQGCAYALAGHSERRHVLGESDAFVGKKVSFGMAAGLKMILCVGETIDERRAGKIEAVLASQLRHGLRDVLDRSTADNLAIAYEPVWAIGTGEVAGPEEILAAHLFVRAKLIEMLPGCGADVRILYGGSVKPDNAAMIVGLDNVDGVLVGGASLKADSFSRIVLA